MTLAFAQRWARAHGADTPQAEAAAAAARASRYPAPLGAAWPALLRALDVAGPALFAGRPGRASQLSDADFDAFEAKMQHHPLREVRLLWLLARAPMLEQRYPDEAPVSRGPHPLRAFDAALRERASHRNARFDVIVIGSGAGGAPLAAKLARSGQSVAIVEAGGLLETDRADAVLERHFLEQGMLPGLGGGGLSLVLAGRAVGGTTVINSGTSLRPRPERLADWAGSTGGAFQAGSLDTWLDRVVADLGVGPIPEALLDASSKLVREGLAALGREGAFPLDRNAPDCEGSARCCFGCPTGAKRSVDRSYLPDAVAAGATLLSHTVATGLREDADGVQVMVRGPTGTRRLRARRLVLAAGAIHTPLLLRANRLGAAWRLAGDGLRIHPASKVFAWMPEPLPHGGVPQALGYRPPELPRVTFEGAHTPAGVTATVLQLPGQRHRAWMDHHDHLANYGLMVRDRGTGRVRGAAGRPVLDYTLHDEDARDLGAGLKLAAEALFAAGAERVVLPRVGGPAEIGSLAELRALPSEALTRKTLLTSGFHPQGTAGVGRVVDGDLRLYGSERVYVSDASVLPDSPGVNPQLAIMAFALRLADHLLQTR